MRTSCPTKFASGVDPVILHVRENSPGCVCWYVRSSRLLGGSTYPISSPWVVAMKLILMCSKCSLEVASYIGKNIKTGDLNRLRSVQLVKSRLNHLLDEISIK